MDKLPNLEHLLIFSKVVEAGSFAAVSRSLNIPKSSLSRKISQLEEDFGAQLFIRSTRKIRPTEIGKELYNRSLVILGSINEVKKKIHSINSEPKGYLRITAGVEFGVAVLNKIIHEFTEKYPKIIPNVELTSRIVDIIYEGVDVAIRIGKLKDSGLFAKKLGEFRYVLLVSPKFLKNNPVNSYKDLEKHKCLVFRSLNNHNESWTLVSQSEEKTVKVNVGMSSNNHWSLIESAKNNQGIIFAPRFLASHYIESGELVTVLEKWSSHPIPVHAVFPTKDSITPNTRVFIDFLVTKLTANYLT